MASNLKEMLESHPVWEELNLEKQTIFLRLAQIFESTDRNLQLTAEELVHKTEVGHRHQWWEFLDLEPVENYIRQQQQRLTKVATRKTLAELQKEVQQGNVGAAKEIHQLAGILEKQDSNKVIILHHIDRPKEKEGQV